MSSKRGQLILGLVIVAILVAPIAVYIWTFGITISSNHQRWGEMGSAMSGIYSPLIAFLALVVVARQLKAQEQINRHEFDQSYIQEARSDLMHYLELLSAELETQQARSSTVRDIVHTNFLYKDIKTYQTEEYAEMARGLNRAHPALFNNWAAIYAVLVGLGQPKRFPYDHNHSAARQKIVGRLTFDTCVALDNFHWCLTKGFGRKRPYDYEFTPDIPPLKQSENS